VIADRLVDEEQAARAALGDEPADIVEARDEPRGLGPGPLLRQTLPASRVRVLPIDGVALTWTGRKLRDE